MMSFQSANTGKPLQQPSGGDDDILLLARIAEGSEQAFETLFHRYKGRFYAVVLKMTRSDEVAEDIVQEVFMRIWQNRSSLKEIENPSAYFFTTVYRKVYRYYKKLAREHKLMEEGITAGEDTNTTEEMVMLHESEKLLHDAIEKLPPQQQAVFILSRQEGLSREAIASRLNISPNTVRNHLLQATRFVKAHLHDTGLALFMVYWLLEK